MKILLTGATGFIGSHLLESYQLLTNAPELVLLVRDPDKLIRGLHHKVNVIKGDLSDVKALEKAVSGVDVVIHLAGAISAPRVSDYFQTNTEGSRNLARAIERVNPSLKKWILVSSLAAGGPGLGRTEEDEDAPVSNYGRSKLEAEREVDGLGLRVPMLFVRPCIVFGPRDRGTLALFKMVRNRFSVGIRSGSGLPEKVYSFIYVKDLCRILIHLANTTWGDLGTKSSILYLSHPESMTMQVFFRKIQTALQYDWVIRFNLPFTFLSLAERLIAGVKKWVPIRTLLNQDKLNEIKPDAWVCSNQALVTRFGWNDFSSHDLAVKETTADYLARRWI